MFPIHEDIFRAAPLCNPAGFGTSPLISPPQPSKILFRLNVLILHLFHFKCWYNRAQNDIWAFFIVPTRNERQFWCCITRVHQTDIVQLGFSHLLRLAALLVCESQEI